MGPTEWTVISTGLVILIAIAGAFGSLRNELINQRKEMTDSHNTLRQDYNALRQEMAEGYNALRQEMAELRERMAKLEGLLEGLREAISGRHVASTGT